jgi:hypothetical protein
METTVKTGDNVLISPDLTEFAHWEEKTVIEVENNTFGSMIIAPETEYRNVFFGIKDLFRIPENAGICLQ